MKVGTVATGVYSKITNTQDKFQSKTFQSAKSINGLNAKLDSLGRQRGAATTVREVRKINREVNRTSRQLKKLENMPPQSMINRLNGVGGAMKGWAGAAVGAFGAMSLFNGVKGVVQLGLDAEQTRVKFATLLGGVSQANSMIQSLNKFANVTPFENAELQKNAELLLNFGMAEKKVLPSLKMLGDISGGNKEKLNSLTLAYAQARSAGKLMGQDLLQMINAGFNPLEVISRKTGKSIGYLKDQMSKGKISATVLEDAFKTATSKGGRFSGMMEKVSQTGLGKISTFTGNLKTNLAGFAEKYLVPTIVKGIDFGIALVNSFDKIKNSSISFFSKLSPLWNSITSLLSAILGLSAESNAAATSVSFFTTIIDGASVVLEVASLGISTMLNWLKPLAPLIRYVTIAYGLWKIAMIAVNVVMYANPVGLVIGAIVALVGTIVYAYNKVGWFRGGVMAAWETIKGFANIIKEYAVNRVQELIKGLSGLAEAFHLLFVKRDWKAAWEVGKKAGNDLLGLNSSSTAIKKAIDLGKTAGTAYSKGVEQANKSKFFKTGGLASKLGFGNSGIEQTQNALAAAGAEKGISAINGGGSRQTNINVSFEKQIENFILKTTTVSEGFEEMEDKLKEMLLRVMNSINQMQTSNG
ncbi:tape measure protein [Aquimarina sp. TRL1]|uniref:tape measure protein n=1 Tax=Aquimarina sp. (strain TRL1) TaxID=2736252 RepID=UPI00158CDE28|nr:tape measure protein [Aquimarina sp. TRL1]QKX04886.1 tape measure protein [Aquimarina sp. TRL1]